MSNYKGKVNSSINQDIKRKFVDREVVRCATVLISELAQKAEYMDELLPVMVQDDYEEPAREYIENMRREDCLDYLFDVSTPKEIKTDKLREMIFEIVKKDFQEFCEGHNIDPYTIEALEHWIVSGWLARKLEAKGEMILDDFLGFTIWGRCGSGQAILLDGVISKICADMEILDGQANSWAPKKNTEPDQKRLRQVRDALNKTKNRGIIEQIANILNI